MQHTPERPIEKLLEGEASPSTPLEKLERLNMKNSEEQFMSSHDARRIAGVSPATVRLWANPGKLAAIRTSGGMRLFRRSEVEAVVQKRKESSTAKR